MSVDPATTELINRNPAFFEKAVLAMCLQDRSFYELVCPVLCRNAATGEFIDDFHDVMGNAIYAVQKKYILCFAMSGATFKPMDATICRALLESLIDDQLLLSDEVDPSVELFIECMQMSPGQVEMFVKNGFTYWLQKRRAQWMYTHQVQSDDWNPVQVFAEIGRALNALELRPEGKKGLYGFGEGLDEACVDVERYNTGLPALNDALGGGLGRKEFTLFIGGTGSGKTIVATQLASQFASQGRKGIIITTEEPHQNLELRIVSNFCHVPYALIKDGFKPSRLSPVQIQSYVHLRTVMAKNLFIRDWLEDRSKSILSDLDNEIRAFKDEHGTLDFVILDWIGSALGALNLNKPEAIRHVYQATADKMSDLALAHDIPTIAFAQANPTLSANKRRIDQTCLAECKSMGRNATNIIGITALMDLSESDEEKAIYLPKQEFFVSKARKSAGGRVPFRRQFEYQRIAAWA